LPQMWAKTGEHGEFHDGWLFGVSGAGPENVSTVEESSEGFLCQYDNQCHDAREVKATRNNFLFEVATAHVLRR
jgi:hypothetical protein